jgi:tellurite resistance protein TerC
MSGNPLIKLLRKLLPLSDNYDGGRFVTRQNGRLLLTPIAMALIMIEATDVIFAVDSIPAIFGITRDPFIVYTSNVCALLGLRSLYFLLAGVVHKFVYLKPALAVILCFVGIKILLTDICPIPTTVSLGIVGLILLSAIGLSLLLRPSKPSGTSVGKPAPKPSQPVANTR